MAREREIPALIAARTPNKVIARKRTQAALWAQKHFSAEDAGSS